MPSAEVKVGHPGAGRVVAVAGMAVALVVLVVVRVVAGGGTASSGAGSRSAAGSTGTASGRSTTTLRRLSAAELSGLRFAARDDGISGAQSASELEGTDGFSAGVAIADVDGDGRPDVFLTREGRPDALFHNDGGGRFHDVAAASGLGSGGADHRSGAAVFADLDGDGHPDLVVSGTAGATLFMNDGHGHFTDETAARGIAFPTLGLPPDRQMLGLAVGDVNGDGWLDLVVTEWDTSVIGQAAMTPLAAEADAGGSLTPCRISRSIAARGYPRDPGAGPNRSRLFLNTGSGHFRDATTEYGLDALSRQLAFTPQFVDLDGDGWVDLLVTGDGCTTRLYHNDHGRRFVDVTVASHLGTDENGMGAVVADVNGDGRPDIFVTSISDPVDRPCPAIGPITGCSGNRLYLNDGDGTFTDATDRYGVRDGGWGWGAAFADFGNDGRRELVMTNGYIDSTARHPGDRSPAVGFFARFVHDPMRFWVPRGGTFVDAAGAVGLDDTGVGHGLAVADLDGDGRLDIVVAEANRAPRVYGNEAPSDRSWVTVRLRDRTHPGNVDALGSKVAVTPRSGGPTTTGWIDGGGSYQTQDLPEMHVGLGAGVERVATVEVWWPGATTPQAYGPFPVDRVLTIDR